MRLKWNMNNVVSARGNTLSCIAKFDNCHVWLEGNAIMSVQTFKQDIREIAKLYGAKSVEVKYLRADDEAGTLTESKENIVLFCGRYDTDGSYRYKFFTKTINSETGRAEVHYLAPEEIFDITRVDRAA